jgi:hypothetical protein
MSRVEFVQYFLNKLTQFENSLGSSVGTATGYDVSDQLTLIAEPRNAWKSANYSYVWGGEGFDNRNFISYV